MLRPGSSLPVVLLFLNGDVISPGLNSGLGSGRQGKGRCGPFKPLCGHQRSRKPCGNIFLLSLFYFLIIFSGHFRKQTWTVGPKQYDRPRASAYPQ